MRKLNRQRGMKLTQMALRYLRLQLQNLRPKQNPKASQKAFRRTWSDQKLFFTPKSVRQLEKLQGEIDRNLSSLMDAEERYEQADVQLLIQAEEIRRLHNELYAEIRQIDRALQDQGGIVQFFPKANGQLKLTGNDPYLLGIAQKLVAAAEGKADLSKLREIAEAFAAALQNRPEREKEEKAALKAKWNALDRAQNLYNQAFERLQNMFPAAFDRVELCFMPIPKQRRSYKTNSPQNSDSAPDSSK